MLSNGEIVVMDNLSNINDPRVGQLIKAPGTKIAERSIAAVIERSTNLRRYVQTHWMPIYFKACGYDTDWTVTLRKLTAFGGTAWSMLLKTPTIAAESEQACERLTPQG
jgi:hypothetical protein